MKTNKQTGFVPVLIFLIIVVVLVLGGGALYYKEKKKTERIKNQNVELVSSNLNQQENFTYTYQGHEYPDKYFEFIYPSRYKKINEFYSPNLVSDRIINNNFLALFDEGNYKFWVRVPVDIENFRWQYYDISANSRINDFNSNNYFFIDFNFYDNGKIEWVVRDAGNNNLIVQPIAKTESGQQIYFSGRNSFVFNDPDILGEYLVVDTSSMQIVLFGFYLGDKDKDLGVFYKEISNKKIFNNEKYLELRKNYKIVSDLEKIVKTTKFLESKSRIEEKGKVYGP
ncbi:MAG: hypothetical protein WC587_03075 [Candidatus Paceibacterota bacterium]